ncbi:hypothetical protein C8R47DRAFT_1145659 [Mycena vitilis]|nr:hypothetical protein C8R47DRAFT_1145659 [Mycena vitilis]
MPQDLKGMHDEPVFPLDLERDIFEFTALKYPSTIPHLLRVCRRVLAWVEPILYRVLRLDKPIPMWVIQSGVVDLGPPTPPQTPSPATGVARLFGSIFRHSPRSESPTLPRSEDLIYRDRSAFLRANVKHISLTMPLLHRSTTADWQRVSGILLLNPAFFELVIRQYTSTESGLRQPIPAVMRPTRLTLQFGRDGAGIVSIDLTEPLFSYVTHLTLLNTPESRHHLPIQTHWAAEIPTLPALTHLCVSPNIAEGLVPAVLEKYMKLRAFVAAWLTDPPIPAGRKRLAALRVRADTPEKKKFRRS